MQMNTKIVKYSIFIIVFLLSGFLHAAENSSPKSRITIYNFQMLDIPQKKSVSVKKKKTYQYYSFILPETISKKLKESDRFILDRTTKIFSDKEILDSGKAPSDYIAEFSSVAEKTGSDYIVTGQYEVIDKQLHVKVFIFNAAIQKFQEITAQKDETGLYLRETPDLLAEDIEQKITDIIVKQSEKKIIPPDTTPLSYVSIGLDSGYLFLSGEWKDVYNNTVYYSPYISFDLTSFLNITLKFDYFTTDSNNMDVITYSSINVMGGSALLGLKYQFSPNFGIYCNAGGGASRTETYFSTEPPFTTKTDEQESTDTSLELGLGIKINFSSIYLRSGILYKRIYLPHEWMDMGIIYGGAGIDF